MSLLPLRQGESTHFRQPCPRLVAWSLAGMLLSEPCEFHVITIHGWFAVTPDIKNLWVRHAEWIMLCSEFVNEFPLCFPKEGTGKKKGGGCLRRGKDHNTLQIRVLDDSVEKASRNCFSKKKKTQLLFSGGTVINFRVENELASFRYP